MTIVASHAMRRYSPSSPSGNYFVHHVGEDPSCQSSSPSSQSPRNCNDLSNSRPIRLNDPWLYGSVRAAPPPGFFLTPALILCTCPDYINGTKRSTKKGPTNCKKCKGTRLPLHMLEPTMPSCANVGSKYGTMRCYPTTPVVAQGNVPFRAGTTRVSSSSRPTILPNLGVDPYEFLRKSRTSNFDSNNITNVTKRSKSPSKSIRNDTFSLRNNHNGFKKCGTAGRKSILECEINPYDLVEVGEDQEGNEKGVTFLNGQRIRVRPSLPENDYEDVIDRRTISEKSINGIEETKSTTRRNSGLQNEDKVDFNSSTKNCKITSQKQGFSSPNNVKVNGSDTYKSILKKTCFDSDLNGRSRENRRKSNFYMNNTTVRKKVQFMDENEVLGRSYNNYENVNPNYETKRFATTEISRSYSEEKNEDSRNHLQKTTTNDLLNSNVKFNDTMTLRTKSRKTCDDFSSILISPTLDVSLVKSLSKNMPTRPPPPLPPVVKILQIEEPVARNEKPTLEDCVKSEEIGSSEMLEEVNFIPMAPPRKKTIKVVTTNVGNNESGETALPCQTEEHFLLEKDILDILPSSSFAQNKTVVQIRSIPDAHKIQIKNDYSPVDFTDNVSNVSQRKTSILINGDNCYSTVNVNDDTPLYLSSVVVSDANNTKVIQTCALMPNDYEDTHLSNKSVITLTCSPSIELALCQPIIEEEVEDGGGCGEENEKEEMEIKNVEDVTALIKVVEELKIDEKEVECKREEEEEEEEESKCVVAIEEEEKKIKEILRDPVEAVRLNLVPHVCGKADIVRRPQGNISRCCSFTESVDTLNDKYNQNNSSDSGESARQDSSITSTDTGNSSMHYEVMEQESDFYTDHSNRSSVAEDDSVIRSKFYELLADSTITELSETDDHQYESIRNNPDPIYEEIEIPPPLPTSPPPKNIIDDLQLDKQIMTRSIFEGASKYDILSYLVDAKERGIVPEDSYVFGNSEVVIEEESLKEPIASFNRSSQMSTISDSSEDSSLIIPCTFNDERNSYQKSAEVERNDSGVGSETSKVSLTKYRNKLESVSNCEDCESTIEIQTESEALLCRKCSKRRSERKEIITEIVETEEKYSRDLQIILEEFYQPMLVAGLLTQDQLSTIFLNVEELLENSQALAERLRDAVEIAAEQGDEDLLTVNMGKLFSEAAPMLHAFETYCVRQAGASLLLASLEKEKELLRIFLRVSQMENTMLRRMNLNSFLMVPVQRVTKYPLLLARLYKATPIQHDTREQLMEAKHQIELHLNHMNSETKDVPSKLWRRIGSNSGRRLSTEMDLVSIKLRKIAVDVLEWNHEEAKFALEGKLLFTQPTDNNWRKGRTIKLTPVNALLVTNGKIPPTSRPERLEDDGLRFPRGTGIREAALLLVRDKNGRYSLLRDPLYLDRCVIATDPAWQSYFEVQEVIGKDTFIFKAEDEEMTQTWYKELQFHAQGLGIWRKRRNALANIMINGMGLRT